MCGVGGSFLSQPDANFLRLADNGAHLRAAGSAFAALRSAIGLLNWYFALNGINILLMIARCDVERGPNSMQDCEGLGLLMRECLREVLPWRCSQHHFCASDLNEPSGCRSFCCGFCARRLLRLMDFQPRLGVVTRSLALASSDLVHFMLVAGCVFLVRPRRGQSQQNSVRPGLWAVSSSAG